MTPFFTRPPKAFVVLATLGGLTLLSGCVGDDEYTRDYWARPDYSYAHNGDYDTGYYTHRHCHAYATSMDPSRHSRKCYNHSRHHHNMNYGFTGY